MPPVRRWKRLFPGSSTGSSGNKKEASRRARPLRRLRLVDRVRQLLGVGGDHTAQDWHFETLTVALEGLDQQDDPENDGGDPEQEGDDAEDERDSSDVAQDAEDD